MKDILSIRAGQCRFCLTDDTPFIFCADPVQPESSYCPEHHRLCHNGFGREVAALEATIIRHYDKNIVRIRGPYEAKIQSVQHKLHYAENNTVTPVDVQIRGRE